MISKEEMGNKIRELRQKTGKSQEELGKALSRSHAAVSDIERGKTDLTVSDLYTIANFFDVPVSDFLDTPQSPFPSYVQNRDAKDITPEEKKIADKFSQEFIKHARELAKNNSKK